MPLSSNDRRLVFAGTPDFASHILGRLIDSGHRPVAVFTQPDRPAGRGRHAAASAVKRLAVSSGIAVFQPLNFRDEDAVNSLEELAPDLMVVVAYGLILPQRVLNIPREGCLNIHASLLPRWRGAAPIQRALMAGDRETGVCLMRMEAGLDTGPVISAHPLEIRADDTATTLHDRLAGLGAEALVDLLNRSPHALPAGTAQADTGVTYATKLSKDESDIDWQDNATALALKIRGLHGWPVASTALGDGRLRIWSAQPDMAAVDAAPGTVISASSEGIRVAAGSGSLWLTLIQMPGGVALPAREVLNGHAAKFTPGTRLGGQA